MRIIELRYADVHLSIRKIHKKLHISKTTVLKYIKLFNQGYDPNQVNIQLTKKKTPLSNTQQSEEKILLPEYIIEDESESDSLEHTVILLNQQIRILEKDNINLNEELYRCQEELVGKNEEIEDKTHLQEQNNKITKLEEANKNLKGELCQCKEQLVRKDEENKKLKQLIQKMNDDAQITSIQVGIDRERQYIDTIMQKVEQIKAIQNKGIDRKKLDIIISKEVPERYEKAFLSNAKDRVQKEPDAKKPQDAQTPEKIEKYDLEVKKSRDNKSELGVDILQIGALSLISFCKGLQNGLNNDNQIILLK